MNIIEERDQRTKKRKKAKAKFDKEITLSASPESNAQKCTLSLNKSEGKVRLLDEGSIVTANNSLDFYIKKGTIKKYANGKNKKLTYGYVYGDYATQLGKDPDEPMNIDEKYEGSINVGHNDFATFPFIVGNWHVSDLEVVNNEDGRKGLDVDMKLNEAHPFVQAFRVQGIPLGVSVEMYLHVDEKSTREETERRAEYTPVVDEIFISDFAIVGECGNVGSSGSVDFQGVKMDEKEKEFDPVLEEVAEENETGDEIEEIDLVEEPATEETEEAVEDAVEEEVAEEVVDNEDTGIEQPEEDEEVEADEAADGEESENEEVTLSMVLDKVNELTNRVSELANQNDMLKKQNRKLKGKLQAKNEEEKKFFQGLSISLGAQDEPKKEEKTKETVSKDYANGDGIGE